MRSLTIQIPEPCHERWADMQPNEQGRFCANCQKTVVDYTALSDQELVKRLRKAPDTSCGRFRDEQLNRPLPLANWANNPAWRQWIGLMTMSLFGWQTARAQLSPASKPPHPESLRSDFTVASLPARQSASPPTMMTIDGRVTCMDSSGNTWTVPQAYVSVALYGKGWQTQTDSAGVFTLAIPAQPQATELTVRVFAPSHLPGTTTLNVLPSTCSVAVNTIVLRERLPMRNITGGGLTLIRTPSRWQKLKQKLFH